MSGVVGHAVFSNLLILVENGISSKTPGPEKKKRPPRPLGRCSPMPTFRWTHAALGAVALFLTSTAIARPVTHREYKEIIAKRQGTLREQWQGRRLTPKQSEALSHELIASLDTLADYWIGSSWGRGVPQSNTPHQGKTNCGTFVGTLLRDAGFVVNIKKLQRLPSQGIIRSFVRGKRVQEFAGSSMVTFLAGVRKMGPGLFIIGMDAHVGLLIQTDTELHYMHSSSETGKVVKELAAKAWTIESSRYRIVGKILSRQNMQDWLRGRRIKVRAWSR